MVWQETRATAIVIMLMDVNEIGRVMFSEYFPCDPDIPTVSYVDNDSGDEFTAIVSDTAVHNWKPQGVLSTMQLNINRKSESQLRSGESQANEEKSAGTSKEVLHYRFIAWPQYYLPRGDDREALISLSEASRCAEEDRDGSPRIVHSNGGGERTGTFIALDFLLGEIEDGAMETSDAQTDMIFDTVCSLREQRIRMVQHRESYGFLYEVMKEELTKKLALDAKQCFLSRWSKVLISASVTQFDYEIRLFCIDGCSADGIDRSISRSVTDLHILQDGLELKFPREQSLRRTRRWFLILLEVFEQERQSFDFCHFVDGYIQELISMPLEIAISTEFLEFFTPREHEFVPFQSEVSRQDPSEREKNKKDAKVVQDGKRSIDINATKPTYIKVHRKHLSPDTLDLYDLPWEWDEVSYTNIESGDGC